MKFKETIEKAYGSIPKEATPNLNLFNDFNVIRKPKMFSKWIQLLFKKKKK